MRYGTSATGFMDYVSTAEPWICEGHHFKTAEEAEILWRELVDRMLYRVPPRKELDSTMLLITKMMEESCTTI
jgi:hypothetical protein